MMRVEAVSPEGIHFSVMAVSDQYIQVSITNGTFNNAIYILHNTQFT